MRRGGIAASAASLCLAACTPAPRPWPSPDASTYARLRGQLEARREARPVRPWAAGIHVVLREPRSGRAVEGRGAIAVAPGRAVRMILLGGAGSTMLDAWVSPERYRIAIPALDQVRRGTEAEVADLPVGFLRWWFLAPLTGTLFAAATMAEQTSAPPSRCQQYLVAPVVPLVPPNPAFPPSEWGEGEGSRVGSAPPPITMGEARVGAHGMAPRRWCADEIWLLREGQAVVEVRTVPCEHGQGLMALRRARGRAEQVLECRARAAGPSVGDVAEYDDRVSGLHVRIDVESVASEAPDEQAFRDPDAPAGAR